MVRRIPLTLVLAAVSVNAEANVNNSYNDYNINNKPNTNNIKPINYEFYQQEKTENTSINPATASSPLLRYKSSITNKMKLNAAVFTISTCLISCISNSNLGLVVILGSFYFA